MAKRQIVLIREKAIVSQALRKLRTERRMAAYPLSKRGLELRTTSATILLYTGLGMDRCKEKGINPTEMLKIFFNGEYGETSNWLLRNTENDELRLLLIKAKMIGSGKNEED